MVCNSAEINKDIWAGARQTYNKTCATSEDSDQPAHPHSLVRVFADRMCLLQPPGYHNRDKQEPLPTWVSVQADLRRSWSYRSYCTCINDVQPAKTQISLRICAVWSDSSLIARTFYSLRAIQRGINKNPCHSGWVYRLIWDFTGHTDLIVGFVVRWFSFSSMGLDTRGTFSVIFWQGRQLFWRPICFPAHQALSEKESIPKGKNLLKREENFFPFRVDGFFKRTQNN